ncbi:hypothetical protein Ae201684P_018744 [Aphanomyces euteiches]|nr:hypothetical protein Ae201684P_018744 [Aphanomyces euteiches]
MAGDWEFSKLHGEEHIVYGVTQMEKIHLNRMILPDAISNLSMHEMTVEFLNTFQWPKMLASLVIDKVTMQGSGVFQKLPTTLSSLALMNFESPASSNIDFSNVTSLILTDSSNLNHLINVTLSDKLTFLKMSNLTLKSWCMNSKTYNALKKLKQAPTATCITPISLNTYSDGVSSYRLKILFDSDDCTHKNGTKMQLWSCSVCVYDIESMITNSSTSAPTNGSSTPSSSSFISLSTIAPTILPSALETTIPEFSILTTSSPFTTDLDFRKASLFISIGISLGSAVFVALALYVAIHRWRSKNAKGHENVSRQLYGGVDSPTILNGEVPSGDIAFVGLDMTQLSTIRLDVKQIRFEKKLGFGAFANVWLGFCQDEMVAIKKLHSYRRSVDQLKAFVDEINLMASFNSPYIVKLIGAAWTRPVDIHCVMEFMDSGDLKNYLEIHKLGLFAFDGHYSPRHQVPQCLARFHQRHQVDRLWHFKGRYASYDDSWRRNLSMDGSESPPRQILYRRGRHLLSRDHV